MLTKQVQSLLTELDKSIVQKKTIDNLQSILESHNLSDPFVANTALFVMQVQGDIHKSLWQQCVNAKKHIKDSTNIISQFVSEKTKNRSAAVFNLNEVFLSAISKTKGEMIVLGNKETKHRSINYPLEASRQALKQASIVLTQAVAVTPKTIIQPVGSELLAELAFTRGIPYYCIASGWHASPDFSFSSPKFSRRKAVHKYECVNPKFVTGIISELGLLSHKNFLKEVNKAYPWIL